MNKRLSFILGGLLIAVMLIALNAPGSAATTALAQATAEPTAPADPLGGATSFAKANQLTQVTVMLDWTPNTNHIGIYEAQAKGYYQEANLLVRIQQPGDVQVEQIVALNKAQFGVSYEEQATYSRANNVPIVSVAAIIQHNTSGFASLDNKKPVKTPADLVGLRYGSFGSAIEKPIINSLITCAGGKPDSFEMVDIGTAEPFPLMDRDRIDFVWLFYAWDGIRAQQQGLKVDFLMLKDYTNCVPDYYTPLLITNETMIKEQPDVVRAFVQATARGYAYAIQNPTQAADTLLMAAPDLDVHLVEASAVWLANEFQADAPRWGEQRLDVWQRFSDYMVKNGALKAPIDAQAAFTNDFLPGK